MTEKKKLELNEESLDKVSGGCDDHDPNFYAAPPTGRSRLEAFEVDLRKQI